MPPPPTKAALSRAGTPITARTVHTVLSTPYWPHHTVHTVLATLHWPHRTVHTVLAPSYRPRRIGHNRTVHTVLATPYWPHRTGHTVLATPYSPHCAGHTILSTLYWPHRPTGIHLVGELVLGEKFSNKLSLKDWMLRNGYCLFFIPNALQA